MAADPQSSSGRAVDRVLSHFHGVRGSGEGWVARCSHHDDRQASLSIKEGADGRVLLHCFAGCANADVVLSAGLSFPDLFSPGSRERLRTRAWLGAVPVGANGRPALVSMGDDQSAAMLAELARLAKVRDRLDTQVAAALRTVAGAVGVSQERLLEAVRDAVDGVEPA
ncbi:MAG: hypothetical protein M3R48_05075 [Candidatus Dormibacteraeota bacterium]|nr:hypothetical protein [Candidatus Dormibacteraeota bacterium]